MLKLQHIVVLKSGESGFTYSLRYNYKPFIKGSLGAFLWTHINHYLIRASMVLVNFFGNNIDDVPGGFEIFT